MYQNRISLIGFIGNDVELRSTKNGVSVAVLSLATKSSWKNGNGEYDSRTEWHRLHRLGQACGVSPASWRKAPTFRLRANSAIASTSKIEAATPTRYRLRDDWLKSMPDGS
jgi:hypothetical protein